MKKNFFLPENVIDLFGQRSVGFMAVNLGGFASNVHFAFGLFDLIFFEGIFQLCHFTSNICNSRREKMCKQMYTSKLNKFDQLIGKTNMRVSLQEEKSFVNRLWTETYYKCSVQEFSVKTSTSNSTIYFSIFCDHKWIVHDLVPFLV